MDRFRFDRATLVFRPKFYGVAPWNQKLQFGLDGGAVRLVDVQVIGSLIGLLVLTQVRDDPIIIGHPTGLESVTEVVRGHHKRRTPLRLGEGKCRFRKRDDTNRLDHGVRITRVGGGQFDLIFSWRVDGSREIQGLGAIAGNVRQGATTVRVWNVEALCARRPDQPEIGVVVHTSAGVDRLSGNGGVVGFNHISFAPFVRYIKVHLGRGVDPHRRDQGCTLVTLVLRHHAEVETVADDRVATADFKTTT